MTGCPLRSTAPARAERVAAGTATTAATTRTAARRARDARRGSVMTRGDIDPFDDRLERAAATVAPADEPKQSRHAARARAPSPVIRRGRRMRTPARTAGVVVQAQTTRDGVGGS